MGTFVTEDMCQNCARCCQNFPFVEVSSYEINKLACFTGLNAEQFTNPKGKTKADGYFLSSKTNGTCIFLGEINGHASCTVYEVRPEICRTYPANKKQLSFCKELQRNSQ